MKFKNYKNSYSGDNRIFYTKEIADMSVRDVFKNKDAIIAQHRDVGIPTENELKSSDNVVYVKEYTREDGTVVHAHYRSKPDGDPSNNLSNSDSSSKVLEGRVSKDEYINQVPVNNSNSKTESNQKPVNNSNSKTESNQKTAKIEPTPQQKEKVEELAYSIDGYISTTRVDEILKAMTKPLDDYENLTPIEKAQKFASKHWSIWTPSEYYGISEYLADDGVIPDKYKKNNDFFKVKDIKNEHIKDVITKKVIKGRKDCPVGPYINSPLDDVDVVIPKDGSEIVKKVLESNELSEFVQENYANLKSGKIVNGSIEFKQPEHLLHNAIRHPITTHDKLKRFTVLHKIDIVDAKMESDGAVTMKIVDYYDFSWLNDNLPLLPDSYEQLMKQDINETLGNMGKNFINNKINRLNNRAYNQQKYGKMKPYVIYKELRYKI